VSAPAKATARDWIGLAVIALPCIVYAMDLTVLDLALPAISADLKPGSAQLLWIADIYGFMVAGSLMIMGTLGDRIGRRRILMIGAAAFAIASTAAAFSASPAMLIAMRALLGIAGATVAPSTLSLIRNMFLDPRERTVAIGVWATSYSVGGAIGPPAGGLLLEHFRWGSVFLIAIPVMALVLIAAPFVLPEFRPSSAVPIDLLSAAQSMAAVLMTVYGVKRVAEHGLDETALASMVAGAAIAVLFIRRQRRLDAPLVDPAFFRTRAFSVPLASYFIVTFMAFGLFLFAAQYLQLVLGFGPLRAGMWLLPSFAGYMTGSIVTPWIAGRVERRVVMSGGLLMSAAGFALLARVGEGGLTIVAIATFLYSIGMSPVVTLATDAIVGAVPPAHAGVASAISETGSELGGAFGIALLGSLGTAMYRSAVGAYVSNRFAPEQAEMAKATFGGAVSLAAHLRGAESRELLHVARGAFTLAFGVTSAVCCAIAVVTAAAAFLMAPASVAGTRSRTRIFDGDHPDTDKDFAAGTIHGQ
jgi:MFS transporter, DHA2 family, multidrug resistance protein